MSRQNVEVVRASFEAWNARDMDAVRELLVPDVIMRLPEGWPEPGPFVGQDAVMRQGEQMRDTWDADSAEPISDFIDLADHVVVRFIWRTAGRGPESNMEFTIVYTLRKGSIFLMEYFWDHAEALETVGLSAAMSQENLEISRAYLDGISRASQEGLDPEATVAKLAEFWDPEIEWDMSESIVLDIGGVYRGIEAGQQLWREWFTAWETLQFEYELVDAGERVVWLIDLRMRGRSTGIEVPLGKHAFVNTFRNGLMVHSKLYMSQSEALEAVGLSEQEAPAPPSELALHMKRVLPASRPLVFNALTEPDELAKWWGPSGFTAPRVEVDLRAGGSYRIAMQPPDDELFFLSGEFLEVDPPARVAYTFRWEDPDPDDQETVVTLSLGDLGESTELVFTQRAFATEGRRALHEQGWTDGLNRLQELMSSAESGAASAS